MTRALSLLLAACLLAAPPAWAQAPAARNAPAAERPAPPAADSVTTHALDLPGGPLRFTATAGFLRLLDGRGQPDADVGATAYVLDGAAPATRPSGAPEATRPVTFVLNGGPGMASAWLQMGAVGPWRVPMDAGPSTAPVPQPNADTWLDFTDLVFLDPPGTGYSRVLGSDEARERLWSVDGDIAALAQAIRLWVGKTGRYASPKFLLGESYGGFRAPRLARALAEDQGIGLRGLVMLSPVLDFGNHSGAMDVLGDAVVLPSMAAAARAARGGKDGEVDRAGLRDAEEYASGAYLADVLRGARDPEAVERVVGRVAALTGLDPAVVRQHRGLIDSRTFLRESGRAAHRIGSSYDATVTGPDPYPEYPQSRPPDPMLDGLRAVLTGGMLAVYADLRWHPDGPYRLFNEEANRRWGYGRGFQRPESLDALRQALALDPQMHAIVAHGLFDLVTPYYASALLLNQVAPGAGGERVQLLTFPGGHMFYSRDASRRALHDAAAALVAPPG